MRKAIRGRLPNPRTKLWSKRRLKRLQASNVFPKPNVPAVRKQSASPPREKRIPTTPSPLALAALDPAKVQTSIQRLTPHASAPPRLSLFSPFALAWPALPRFPCRRGKKTKVVRTPEQIDRLVQKEIKEYPSIRSQNKISKTCQISAKGK